MKAAATTAIPKAIAVAATTTVTITKARRESTEITASAAVVADNCLQQNHNNLSDS